MRHLLRDDDLSPVEQRLVLLVAGKVAESLKERSTEWITLLSGRTIGLFFEKPSLRTRVSTEVACAKLGAQVVNLWPDELHLGRGESVGDTAIALGGYLDLMLARVYRQELLEGLAAENALPIVNGLSDLCHPLQALADLLTLAQEWSWEFSGRRLVYLGDGNNVAHSLLLSGAMAGLSVTICSPKAYNPSSDVIARANELAMVGGGKIVVTDDLDAVAGADALYTDVWTSMGSEGQEVLRSQVFKQYQLNEALLGKSASDAIVLHCLPAHREQEITSAVLDGKRARVVRQAFNRLPTTFAVLLFLLAPEVAKKMSGAITNTREILDELCSCPVDRSY